MSTRRKAGDQAAEIGRLKVKIAKLEAENGRLKAEVARLGGSLVPPAPAPLIDQPGIARSGAKRKATRGMEAAIKADRRARELREAVKAAERAIEDAWSRERKRISPYTFPVPREEIKRLWKIRDAALTAARAAAREEVRARWAAEDAEGRVEYPPHITRLSNEKAGV
jgi:hypothetical protein